MKMTPEIEDLIDFDFDADPKGNQNSLIERGDTNDQDEGINEFNLKLIKSFEKTDRERNQLIRVRFSIILHALHP